MDIIKADFCGVFEGVSDARLVPAPPDVSCLGLNVDSHRLKLQNQPWATTAMIAAVGEDGKGALMRGGASSRFFPSSPTGPLEGAVAHGGS